MSGSDGQIIIDTKLNDDGAKKGLQDIEKAADSTGKKITDSMNNAEKSMKNAFDGSKIAKQLDNVTKSIDNTNQKLQLQQQKLTGLKEAYKNAADPSQQVKLQGQILKTEASIIKLESALDNLKNKENELKDKQINLKIKTDNIDNSKIKTATNEISKDFDDVSNKAKTTSNEINKALNVKSTNPIKDVGESIEKTGEKISSVGESLTTKVTLPIAAAFGMAAKEAGDFEHQMADVAKEVKAKGENVDEVMSQMSANSIKWSEDFGQSTDDINKGFLILVKDGYSGAESMQIMNTALETARGANEDLFTVIDQLGGSLEAYGQKTDNAAQTTANMSHMADTFAYISNHTKASISSLGEAFATAGQTAAALGQPMEETAAAIGILQSSNIDASTAATSLKAGLVNLTKPTKQMRAAMQELGLQAFDSNGKMKDMSTIINDINKGSKNMTEQQKQAAIAMIFGKESLASWNVLVAKGGDYLKNLADSAGNATGEVKELSDSMKDTPVNKMKEAKESFHALAVVFGEDVLPSVAPVVDKVTELLKSFASLDEETKQEIISWALMAATMGPIAKTVGTITTGIGSLVSFGGRLAASLGLIGEGATLGGEALVGFSAAGLAATGVGAALAAGLAGAVTYHELLNKSVDTSTDDLNAWEKVVNACTGSTIKSKEELQKAGLVYKDFGDGVSKKFQDGIKQADQAYKDFQSHLTVANIGDKISDSDNNSLTNSINKMIDGAKNAITSRKSEIQTELSNLFTADGSGIDENEQKSLDIAAQGYDAKMQKIQSIQSQLTDRWNKAIAEHGKLSEADVAIIKNYLQQINQIKAEVEAENNAESSYAKNEYSERLNGLSSADAAKEYQEASKTLSDNFVKLKATYKTGIDDLTKMEKEAEKTGTQEQVDNLKQQIEEKTKKYEEVTGKEYAERRAYLDELYKQNPNLEGQLNEVTGELFKPEDKVIQGNLAKMKDEFNQIKEVNKTGMIEVNKPIFDESSKMWKDQWHDIEVTVDTATGNITSSYDTLTGEVGGYSKKFQDDAKATGDKIKKSMEDIQKAIESPTGLKIDSDNNALDGSNKLIGQFNAVIDKADKTKVAIANVNGAKVKLEFDKDGVLKNTDDIKAAIDGKIEANPAVVNIDVNDKDAVARFKELEDLKDKFKGDTKTTITIDGKGSNSINDAIDKLEKLPKDTKSKIEIDGTEVATVDDAINKLKEIPPQTNTKITIDGTEVSTIDEAKKKLNDIKESNPNAKISINGEEIPTIDDAIKKLGEIPPDTNTDVVINTDDANSKIDETSGKADDLGNKKPYLETSTNADDTKNKVEDLNNAVDNLPTYKAVTIAITGADTSGLDIIEKTGGEAIKSLQTNYTGSNNPSEGLSYVDEHGYETADEDNVKIIKPGLAYISSHAAGGDGINSHMTTVNEMHNDITSQVTESVGQIVSNLISSLSSQDHKLSSIEQNTAQTVKVGQEGNNLNQDLAKNIVDNYRSSTTGSFSSLNNEINMANTAKENASNMKIEDNTDYVAAKAKVDELTDQIEELKNQSQGLEDDKQVSLDKSTNKAIAASNKSIEAQKNDVQSQQHKLEQEKEIAQKEADLAKEVAQNQIEQAKKSAEEQVKIAEDKKEKLTKIAEATTTAIKNKLTEEKNAYDTTAQAELKSMEDSYNNQVSSLEKSLKKKTDDIDQQIKDLETQSTDTSRNDTRTEYSNKISVLQNKMNNSASYADKQSYSLQIKDAQAELNKQENQWSIDDQKSALETEKSNLEKQEQTKKDSLEKQYNASKEAKEKEIKDTDAYYDKLLEEDSINAQARYMILKGSQNDLVELLNSYNPQWQAAGKSLTDSLLEGININKQSIEQSVNELIMMRSGKSYDSLSDPTNYLDVSTNKRIGYATGTNYNQNAGLYNTNEQGFEMNTGGDVAYVSQGAAIKNHMETQNYIDSLMGAKISTLQASLIQSQQDTIKSLFSSVYGSNSSTTNNNKNILHFNVEHFHNERSQDIEDLSNELAYHAFKQRTY